MTPTPRTQATLAPRCMGIAALLVGLLLAVPAPAAPPDLVLVPPAREAAAGREAVFTLLVTNAGKEPVVVALPEPLQGRLRAGEACFLTTLRRLESSGERVLSVPPGGFRQIPLAVAVPADAQGFVSLELEEIGAPPVVFASAGPPAAPPPPGEAVCEEETQRMEGIVHNRLQPYAANLSSYQPIYFLVGADPSESKFQLSFKYQLLNSEGSLARMWPWVTGLHFGYTQTSFWDLEGDSEPFDDTSYKPEIFFASPNLDIDLPGVSVFKIQTGYQHESNGRGGDDSRSTNHLYLKPIFIVGSGRPYALTVSPRVWAYVNNDDSTNPDLYDYRGYFDLEMKLGAAEGFLVSGLLRWADEGPSVQADLSYPIGKLLSDNLDLYLQAQYFRGYAESLLNYDEHSESFRLGVAIVR